MEKLSGPLKKTDDSYRDYFDLVFFALYSIYA
jgi:hypothetical protein